METLRFLEEKDHLRESSGPPPANWRVQLCALFRLLTLIRAISIQHLDPPEVVRTRGDNKFRSSKKSTVRTNVVCMHENIL